MQHAKCQSEDYIQWLLASPKFVSCAEAARCDTRPIAHDAYTRLLERLEPSSDELWAEVAPLLNRFSGCLVVDDSTLDKPYGPKIEMVTRHWSGKHQAVVEGINLITLLWTDGDIAIPVDWRVYDKAEDGLSKNDHLRQMLQTARQRGFEPQCVLFDSWYSSLDNLKQLRDFKWPFFVGLKSNRQVDPDATGNRAIRELEFTELSQLTHLKGFGWVNAYKVELPDCEPRYFISDQEHLYSQAQVKQKSEQADKIEQYHRSLKQQCHIERCQARKRAKQRTHIALALRAYVRLERFSFTTGISRHEAKLSIVRDAITHYLRQPWLTLPTYPNRKSKVACPPRATA